jgi:protein SCO1
MINYFSRWVYVAVALGMSLVFSRTATSEEEKPSRMQVNLAPDSWPIDAFTLVDQHGHSFTEENFRGHWTFVVFGHTNCKDACHAPLETLARVLEALHKTRVVHTTQILFITLDSERDTPTRLRDYLAGFDRRFIGAIGPSQTLQQLAESLSVSYPASIKALEDSRAEERSSIQLIGPGGLFRAQFFPPYNADALTAEFLKVRLCGRQ